jgi:hypothetical protein
MHRRVFVNRQDPGTCVRRKALVQVNRGDREIGVGEVRDSSHSDSGASPDATAHRAKLLELCRNT